MPISLFAAGTGSYKHSAAFVAGLNSHFEMAVAENDREGSVADEDKIYSAMVRRYSSRVYDDYEWDADAEKLVKRSKRVKDPPPCPSEVPDSEVPDDDGHDGSSQSVLVSISPH